jgi:hypothetical protein
LELSAFAECRWPERTLGFGIRQWFNFKTRQDGWFVSQPEIRKILAFQLKTNRFPQIVSQFIESFSLSDNRQVDALSKK